ncbi:MAG: hypothetical protein JXB40_05400 [Candidatus Omnitrophica bacterium]|nr:hypothetical protein [Candidatus Omnitrophota bacterium]
MKLETIKKLRELPYFTIDDLARISGIGHASAYVFCNRYVKNGVFIRLKNNFYVLEEMWGRLAPEGRFKIANYLQVPSYISFMTALSYYEMTTQVQRDFFESASLKRSAAFEAPPAEFSYYKLKKELYFGFVKMKDFFIATPEKALIDSLYLYSFGRFGLDLDSINMKHFDKAALRAILKVFPKKTKEIAKKICKI